MSGPGAGLDVAVPRGHSAVQGPSAFVPALPPAAHTQSQGQPGLTPHPSTLGDSCACCWDTVEDTEPLTLIPWGWTDAAAGFMDTLARMGCPRRLGLAGNGAGALVRTKPQTSGASPPARAPQPCSAWGCAPPDRHLRTAWPCWLCMAWGHVRTLSLPLDLSSHSGCPHPLSDPGSDRSCVGTDLAAALGGQCGTPAPSFHCKGLPQLCGHCPCYPGTHGGNFSYFLK